MQYQNVLFGKPLLKKLMKDLKDILAKPTLMLK